MMEQEIERAVQEHNALVHANTASDGAQLAGDLQNRRDSLGRKVGGRAGRYKKTSAPAHSEPAPMLHNPLAVDMAELAGLMPRLKALREDERTVAKRVQELSAKLRTALKDLAIEV